MKTTVPCSPAVQQILMLRARAARLRAVYDAVRTRIEPVRHGAAELLLEARALRSRLAAAQLAELRRRLWPRG